MPPPRPPMKGWWKAMKAPLEQPRRYKVRHLRDVEQLSGAEIAKRLGVSEATVSRDLKETVEPAGRTPAGTPFYPAGRFDKDPEYAVAVMQLTGELGQSNARRHVARVFSGAAAPEREPWEASPERMALMEQFAKKHAT